MPEDSSGRVAAHARGGDEEHVSACRMHVSAGRMHVSACKERQQKGRWMHPGVSAAAHKAVARSRDGDGEVSVVGNGGQTPYNDPESADPRSVPDNA
eukprot:1185681-Rhodomonas_salina.1